MLAFLRALATGPVYGLMALLRSWLWIVAVLGGFALLAEVENIATQVAVLVLLFVFQFLLSFSLSREALVSAGGDWAIHKDINWKRAAFKYFGAYLLALLWIVLVIAAVVFAIVISGAILSEETQRELMAWADAKRSYPNTPVPEYEQFERLLQIVPFVLTLPLAVFHTTFIAAAAGNGLLSRNGWTIGFGTLRMLVATVLYGWLNWELFGELDLTGLIGDSPVGYGVAQNAPWVLIWAMQMGCAAQIYMRRLDRETDTRLDPETAARAQNARNASARDIRRARTDRED